MRVAHVTEVSAGGVRRLVADFAADQVRRGLDVHVVGEASLAELPGMHHAWQGSRRRPAAAALDWARLHLLLRDLAPDVVHLHSFFAGAFARTRPVRPPYAVVYQPHSWAFDAVDSERARGVIAGFERWAGRRTDLVATNCADEISEAQTNGIDTRAQPLGVPIDLDYFVPPGSGERALLRARLGIADGAALVCMGRVARQKGYDILVAEWERQPVPGAALYLVGAGSTDGLAALAPRQWGRTIVGVGSTDDPRAWLQAADLLLLPSRYEGQSVAVSEALACGLPVVAFEVNGARSAICDDGDPAGAVVAAGNASALLAEAQRRLDDPELLVAESKRARFRAERDNVAGTVFDRVVGAYEAALAVRRSRGARP
ncbi:MAG: glycosyltransferase [Nocardioidaceae bacterium]